MKNPTMDYTFIYRCIYIHIYQKAHMVMPVPQVKQRPCDWCGSTSARYHCVDVQARVLCTERIADWVASGMNDDGLTWC